MLPARKLTFNVFQEDIQKHNNRSIEKDSSNAKFCGCFVRIRKKAFVFYA